MRLHEEPPARSPLGVAKSNSARRIGSVPYLNAVPLTWGLENEVEFLVPSQLAARLHAGNLEAALISITEVLLRDDYDVLDGFGIVSHGPVFSVFLAHRQPLEEMREIFVDPASCASVNLLQVLLAGRGLQPEFRPLPDYASAARCENVLLIGNPAIAFRLAPQEHRIWDLGEAWHELTGLPFVYAVWALRRGIDQGGLRSRLRGSAESGIAATSQIVAQRPEFDAGFRRAYVGGHIRYRLGEQEKLGVRRFAELLGRHPGRPVFPLRFV